MMRDPPGDPITRTGAPSRRTIVGDIDDRGRLPGATALAIGTPSACDRKEKSVSSLFNRKPLVIKREPKPFSIVVVMDRALPYWSTIEICDVDGSSRLSSSAQSIA